MVSARPTPWKLHWAIPSISAAGRIVTGLDAREVECSPSVCEVEGGVQLSFIGTMSSERPKTPVAGHVAHRLFVMRGPEIDQLEPAVPYNNEHCYSGFARPDLVILSSGEDGTARIVVPRPQTLKTSFRSISRINYCFDAPSRLLLTGYSDPSSGFATVVFDLTARRLLGELKIDGESTYKPSVLAGTAVLPSVDPGTSNFSLSQKSEYSLHPTSIRVELD